MASSAADLIEYVKNYTVLFDTKHPDYKNLKIKNKVWDEIGVMMETDGESLKKRWKNLRDSYIKYLRTQKYRSGSKTKFIARYKTWAWSKQMEFFRPFMLSSQTESNILSTSEINVKDENDISNSETEYQELDNQESSELQNPESSQQIENEEPSVEQNSHNSKMQKIMDAVSSDSSSMDNIISYLIKRQANKESKDDIDLMFAGYAATVKKFSARRQVLVKFKIAKLLMEEELQQQSEDAHLARPGSSTSYVSNLIDVETPIGSPSYENSSHNA